MKLTNITWLAKPDHNFIAFRQLQVILYLIVSGSLFSSGFVIL